MNVDQSTSNVLKLDRRKLAPVAAWRARLRMRVLIRIATVAIVLLVLGGSTVTAQQARMRSYTMAVAGWGFDMVTWETQAIGDKLVAAATRPSSGLAPDVASELVVRYMARADRIGQLEDQIAAIGSAGGSPEQDIATLQKEVAALREQQEAIRPEVEQVIERQVSYALAQAGFAVLGNPFPPVQFTFTEPPRKLVVSPRDRIATIHSRMLKPGMPLAEIEEAEGEINESERARAYITRIGGLGAYPTMVVDRASLEWVLSTVAHEWTHNYLTMHPLGWNYFKSQDLTTLNETVAEIVGNEIGAAVSAWFYDRDQAVPEDGEAVGQETFDDRALDTGEGASTDDAGDDETASKEDAPAFDFREEMRKTRLEVDRLLAEGRVADAEEYMEQRRLFFGEHGHPLRVLNQAYFAFHGSYGTSAASTSPIGPKLRELRQLTPDLKTFVDTVKWFTESEDLDRALDEWTLLQEASGSE